MSISKVKVPDIGDFKNVEVIEVLCKEGQSVAVEDPLITIESDKATIDVPSPLAGRILSIKIKSGDKVSEGNLILELDTINHTPDELVNQIISLLNINHEWLHKLSKKTYPKCHQSWGSNNENLL